MEIKFRKKKLPDCGVPHLRPDGKRGWSRQTPEIVRRQQLWEKEQQAANNVESPIGRRENPVVRKERKDISEY